jgi:hypothetical protein
VTPGPDTSPGRQRLWPAPGANTRRASAWQRRFIGSCARPSAGRPSLAPTNFASRNLALPRGCRAAPDPDAQRAPSQQLQGPAGMRAWLKQAIAPWGAGLDARQLDSCRSCGRRKMDVALIKVARRPSRSPGGHPVGQGSAQRHRRHELAPRARPDSAALRAPGGQGSRSAFRQKRKARVPQLKGGATALYPNASGASAKVPLPTA